MNKIYRHKNIKERKNKCLGGVIKRGGKEKKTEKELKGLKRKNKKEGVLKKNKIKKTNKKQ